MDQRDDGHQDEADHEPGPTGRFPFHGLLAAPPAALAAGGLALGAGAPIWASVLAGWAAGSAALMLVPIGAYVLNGRAEQRTESTDAATSAQTSSEAAESTEAEVLSFPRKLRTQHALRREINKWQDDLEDELAEAEAARGDTEASKPTG